MSVINVSSVKLEHAAAPFTEPFTFDITFEALRALDDDVEWKVIYVGSTEDLQHDQELDSCSVGPIPAGVNNFVFEAAAPTPGSIPKDELLGLTVVILSASYANQEFVRIGYYVNVEYDNEELQAQDPPPDPHVIERLQRRVLAEKPRVTRYNIKWDIEEEPTSAKTTLLDASLATNGEQNPQTALTAQQGLDDTAEPAEVTKAETASQAVAVA
ncbi:hypothetical protein E5Q_00334 [Mixia osmundae IAM 14324]|uniref:Anti-silencing function protein 1 n=1 Tax=Mixia osmundae (strain CBS 9802 / IAM 14324 / JCM 22182 / KY 12970) TaxID=764103 RepID=G7DSX9_MIXOS|nr:hypothetical protein E5Q_00334 [Mixia osmundae IAM 14324]